MFALATTCVSTILKAVSPTSPPVTVIRSGAGRESIVPNEMLITQRVENFSLADTRVWHSTVVSVAYESDVDLVMNLLPTGRLGQ